MRHTFLQFMLCLLLAAVSHGQDDDEFEEVPSTHVPNLMSTTVSIEATVGEPVTFPCDVDSLGDFVLLWKRENNRILFAGDLRIIRDDRIKTDGTSLVISSVQPKDSGEYSCQISTNPPIELAHSLDVLYPPSVRPRPKEALITAKEGESVKLTCDATGNPVPTITWKHAGRHYDSYEENSYVINNAQKNDSGEYECIADNSIGDAATTVITVEIVSAPKVYPEPPSGLLVVKEGEPISIGCDATGDPTPVITWKKPNGEKMMKMNDQNKIMISEASQKDAGNYECIANNSLGVSTTAVIRVQVLFAPKIHMSHSRIHAREGVTVNISCVAEGEPSPTVTWKKDDGQVIHTNEHYHLRVSGHSHILIIRHVKEQDFGRYECSASNSLSSATGSTHVIGTPQIPAFISKPHSTQGTKYTISWRINSHTPVDEYSLMFRKKADKEEWETKSVPAIYTNEEDTNVHTQMFQLVELQPATEYEAVVKARNKFGWSEQSEALVFTTKNEEVPIPTTGETTVLPTISDSSIPATNEKHMENYSSCSCSFNFSLISLFILVICSKYWH
jgi:hypothetical protein